MCKLPQIIVVQIEMAWSHETKCVLLHPVSHIIATHTNIFFSGKLQSLFYMLLF